MNAGQGDTFLAARWLIGAMVVDADGRRLGHVIDLEVDPQNDFRVSALELGRFAWLDRMRIVRPMAHGRFSRPPRIVAWDDVERFERGRLVCRTGTTVRERVLETGADAGKREKTASGG
jgi:hypothetical protein